ncbi:hypothetical protein QUF75_10720 [Desulfococcaceae bacterium HSG7]|nr:hypothetical protein [Desulfococcaceae bacterium HSG7]
MMKEQFNEICAKFYVKSELSISEAVDSLKNEKGQGTVEYGLIIVVICAAVGIAAGIFHEQIGKAFDRIMAIVMETIG